MRRSHLGRARPAAILVLLLLLSARADAFPSYAGGDGLFDVRTALVPPARAWAVSLGGAYYSLDDRQVPVGPAKDVLDGGLTLSVAFLDRVEVFARFGAAGTADSVSTVFSIRDGLLGSKVGLPWGPSWLATAALGTLNLPWGKRERGFSTGSVDPSLSALFTFAIPEPAPLNYSRLHVNVGYQWHGDDRGRVYEGWPLYYLEPPHPATDRDLVQLRAALEFGTSGLNLFLELLLDQLVSNDVAFWESPVFLTPGFRHSIGSSLSVLLASKVAISSDDPATTTFRPPEDMFPEWQLAFVLAWNHGGTAFRKEL